MSRLQIVLKTILDKIILKNGGHKKYFDVHHEFIFDSFADLRGENIPYHLDEWEDIYGWQHMSEEDALRSLKRSFGDSYSYCFHSKLYLDKSFDSLAHKDPLPIDMQEELNEGFKSIEEDLKRDEKRIRVFKMIHLGTRWDILNALISHTLEEFYHLDETTKMELRSIPHDELNEELMSLAREKAHEMMAYYDIKKAAA